MEDNYFSFHFISKKKKKRRKLKLKLKNHSINELSKNKLLQYGRELSIIE